jgi:plastocyanin
MRRLASVLAIAALAVSLAACSAANAEGPASPAASAGPGAVHIDAKNISFTQSSVTAPAGRAFQVVFTSQDSAPHNVTIIGPDGSAAFTGDVINGPASTVYSVPALKAGTYTFRCDIHPNMTGTLVVQ